MGTQVWTLTVFEAIIGGKQRGPSGPLWRQCPLDQLLLYPSHSSGVRAQDCACPKTPASEGPQAPNQVTGHRTYGLGPFQLHHRPRILKRSLS